MSVKGLQYALCTALFEVLSLEKQTTAHRCGVNKPPVMSDLGKIELNVLGLIFFDDIEARDFSVSKKF